MLPEDVKNPVEEVNTAGAVGHKVAEISDEDGYLVRGGKVYQIPVDGADRSSEGRF